MACMIRSQTGADAESNRARSSFGISFQPASLMSRVCGPDPSQSRVSGQASDETPPDRGYQRHALAPGSGTSQRSTGHLNPQVLGAQRCEHGDLGLVVAAYDLGQLLAALSSRDI